MTLHVPLNVVGDDATWHIINDKCFKKMKKGAWFFNTSRGEVTETAALKKVLSTGKPGGAVLDVWENEPDIDIDLMARTFLSTPHIAGYSTDGKAKGTAMVVNSLSNHFNLSLKDWYPENVPPPEHPVINVDGVGKTDEDIIREAVNHTYNIEEDNIRLRFSPSDFEKLRGEYGIRREFSAFTVRMNGGTKKVRKILEGLGFKVV